MTDPGEIARALSALADAFDALGVSWAIGGSLASAAHGEPRATNDVDIVVANLPPLRARALAERLSPDFYADSDAASEAARTHGSFNVIDTRSFLKIDIFVPADGPMGTGQLDRRTELQVVPGIRALPVLAPEDVILQKLRWYAIGGEVSDRQWRDVLSVLSTNAPSLDDSYLQHVAGQAGLAPLLERARHDASRKE